ncbi:SET and MYND domain-containing protein 4-like [Scylla paramamosain]|uniref:SET and MYND domain-containing protein 4-like n=1 Tax=Scylla paramamosain TaxID=85552 RepID=UPI003083D68D
MAHARQDEDEHDPVSLYRDVPSFCFQKFLDDALEKLYTMNAKETRVLRHLISEGNSFEIFEALWNMDEAHEILTPPEKLVSEDVETRKSAKESIMYMRRGDLYFDSNKDVALCYYNRSIIFAPHPPIRIGNRMYSAGPEDVDEDLGDLDYTVLTRCYRARAMLLFKMGKFVLCLKDIGIVQRLGCPSDVNEDLEHMRAHCNEMMSESENAAEPVAAFHVLCREPPALEDPNPHLPAASSAVSLGHNNTGSRRHLYANRDIEQGEILIVEKNYCNILLPKYIRLFCSFCLRRTWTPLPCSACTQVVFCSYSCRTKALTGLHGRECPILRRINYLNIKVRGILACRILFKTTFDKLKKHYEIIMAEGKKPLQVRGVTRDGVFSSGNYLSVYSMVGRKKHNNVDKMARAMEAFVLLKLLRASNRFFVDAEGWRLEPSWEDQLFIGSLLLHHLTNLWRTADAFFETDMIDFDCTQNPMKAVGAGVFPVINLAMGCESYAPCAYFTYGEHLVMRATRTIRAGTVLRCMYSDHIWERMPKEDDEIFAQDVFKCIRDGVIEDVGDLVLGELSLRCVKCQGKVKSVCFKCNLEYNKISPVPGIPNLTTYDHQEVMAMVNELVRRYQRTRSGIRNRLCSTTDLDNVREIISCFDKYVHLPNTVHRDAQLMYIIIMNHMTCSVYHDKMTAPGCSIC